MYFFFILNRCKCIICNSIIPFIKIGKKVSIENKRIIRLIYINKIIISEYSYIIEKLKYLTDVNLFGCLLYQLDLMEAVF